MLDDERPRVLRYGTNKVHYAIHGQTATEVVLSRADSDMPNMGLTHWEGARIRKSDVAIAKVYTRARSQRNWLGRMPSARSSTSALPRRRVAAGAVASIGRGQGTLVSRPFSRELRPRGAIGVRSALASSHYAGSLLQCKQFGGIAIATEAPLVAILEQIRCIRGHVPCTVARLIADFGKSFTPTNLKYMDSFCLRFPIRHKARDESPSLRPKVSWTPCPRRLIVERGRM